MPPKKIDTTPTKDSKASDKKSPATKSPFPQDLLNKKTGESTADFVIRLASFPLHLIKEQKDRQALLSAITSTKPTTGDLSKLNARGETALMIASRNLNNDVVEALIILGANVNIKAGYKDSGFAPTALDIMEGLEYDPATEKEKIAKKQKIISMLQNPEQVGTKALSDDVDEILSIATPSSTLTSPASPKSQTFGKPHDRS